MKIMFLGDTHGDRGFTKKAIETCATDGIDCIVQVGDFGFWPRTNNGKRFLHDVGKHSHLLKVPLYWIDGNHEDHTYVDSLVARRDDKTFVSYGKYPIYYIPRGTVWDWDGVKFGAYGGAFSIDRPHRVEDSPSYGWFRQEMPDPDKMPEGPIDVLVTHDAPIVPPSMYGHGFKEDQTSRESQKLVYGALVRSQARLLVHGHWHINERYGVHGATVQGLAMNHDSLYAAAVVFRTDDRRLFTLREWEYRDAE
jgi:predicted phosphodiesterase